MVTGVSPFTWIENEWFFGNKRIGFLVLTGFGGSPNLRLEISGNSDTFVVGSLVECDSGCL